MYANRLVYNDGIRFWDVRLGFSDQTSNTFLLMSVLVHPEQVNNAIFWARRGCMHSMSDPFQNEGSNNIRRTVRDMPFGPFTIEQAKRQFQIAFQRETLNSWERIDQFVPRPDHYSLLQFDARTQLWTLASHAQSTAWRHPPCICGISPCVC